MNQFIWFHPSYLSETSKIIIEGQINNAQTNGYTVLTEKELYKVSEEDHLTLVGHSTSPNGEDENEDTGHYIQGETTQQCVDRLKLSGLRHAPKIISLESCNAGTPNGFAAQLTHHPFFNYTLIEANSSAIGRNPGTIHWGNMSPDCFGRVVTDAKNKSWIFFHNGKVIARHYHGRYDLQDVLKAREHSDFHSRFFSLYEPGIFGGRVGRYCIFTGDKLTLEKARFFADRDPTSATAQVLKKINQEDTEIRKQNFGNNLKITLHTRIMNLEP